MAKTNIYLVVNPDTGSVSFRVSSALRQSVRRGERALAKNPRVEVWVVDPAEMQTVLDTYAKREEARA